MSSQERKLFDFLTSYISRRKERAKIPSGISSLAPEVRAAKEKSNLEVESRFGKVSSKAFRAVQALFGGEDLEETDTVEYIYSDNTRRVRTIDENGEVESEEWSKKEREPLPKDFRPPFKVSVSEETSLPSRAPSASQVVKRQKARSRFTGNYVFVDMTWVIENDGPDQMEVEVEIQNPLSDLKEGVAEFWRISTQISGIVAGTAIDRGRIKADLLAQFEVKDISEIRNKIPKPQGLEFKQLTEAQFGSVPRVINDKTDGEYKFLFISDYGSYYVSIVGGEIDVVEAGSGFGLSLGSSPLIIAGEYVSREEYKREHEASKAKETGEEKRAPEGLEETEQLGVETTSRGEEHKENVFVSCREFKDFKTDFFVIHDLANSDQKNHKDRIKILRTLKVEENFSNAELKVVIKKFFYFNGVDEYYIAMNAALDNLKTLEYPEDGIICSPSEELYRQFPDQRKEMQTFKWKRVDQLTLDFRIPQPGKGRGVPLSFEERGGVMFSKPWRPRDVTFRMKGLTPGKIYEFRFDYEKREFIPCRERPDKDQPNPIETVKRTWELIRRPLREETLRGKDIVLMREYHNKVVKSRLLSLVDPGSLLGDVGSGRGGDTKKWKEYGLYPICIEPNRDNIKELQTRMRNVGVSGEIVPCGGENVDEILKALGGRQLDAIAMMTSLSFFFESSDKLWDLVRLFHCTLRQGGKVVIHTVDGNWVQERVRLERKKGTDPTGLVRVEKPAYTLEVQGREVFIDIKDSIVKNQREWLVDLPEFKRRMRKIGIEFSPAVRTDEEKFMSADERELSAMYSYMVGERKRVPLPEEIKFYDPVTPAEVKEAFGGPAIPLAYFKGTFITREFASFPRAVLYAISPQFRKDQEEKKYSQYLKMTQDDLFDALDFDIYLQSKSSTTTSEILRRPTVVVLEKGEGVGFLLVGIVRKRVEDDFSVEYLFDTTDPVLKKLI